MSNGSPEDTRRLLVLEQYKSLVDDVGNIGTRYATANGFYLSVVTALLGVLAYTWTGKPLAAINYPPIALITVFAILICYIWRKTVHFYGELFATKFYVLKELELDLPVQVYAAEGVEFYTKRGASR